MVEPKAISISDHPRMRGEDSSLEVSSSYLSKSPPHARGRLGLDVELKKIRGITPACAGKTVRYWFGSKVCTDHPRMRGEDCKP